MSKAQITYRWATGEELAAEIEVDECYPDAVAEAKAQAVALFREGWATLTVETE